MKIRQFNGTQQPENIPIGFRGISPDLILVFGEREIIQNTAWQKEWSKTLPDTIIMAASSAGGIENTLEFDKGWVATAVQFEKCKLKAAKAVFSGTTSRKEAGANLARQLMADDLRLIFVLSDGTNVNGSELVEGLVSEVKDKVPVTGGLAGDGVRFEHTLVSLNGETEDGLIIAVGFYGESLEIGYGSWGGWDAFGVERKVTHSFENEVFEFDGEPALKLYKEYLGDFAKDLPGSALRFPLKIIGSARSSDVIRTIIGIQEERDSLVFAGNIPQGSKVRLMKANFDRLVEGAGLAAEHATNPFAASRPQLALLVSCVGRKVVLGPRVEDELEEVRHILGSQTIMTGFYSYGEICPSGEYLRCDLHNQSMTITTLSEK